MYEYSISNEIAHFVGIVEDLRRTLDRTGPLPRIWLGRTRHDAEAESIAASTSMEGVAVTVDEARRILVGDRPPEVSPDDTAQVEGYRDAMHYVLARADDDVFAWHTELLLAIHHDVLAGSYAAEAGRLRTTQNWLTNTDTGEQVYLPPPPDSVPVLVDQLMEWLSDTTELSPIAAALAHVRLAGIHPFRDGNGRTARIVASLVMYRAGYRSPQFTSLEEWWGRHVDDYYEAFRCLGTSWTSDADVTPFVLAHVKAQATQLAALSMRHDVDRVIWVVLEDLATLDLGMQQRATHALYDGFFAREVTNRYYRGLTDVSAVTASHDLAKLATAGLLARVGAGRGAHYVGTEKLVMAVAAAASVPAERLPIGSPLLQQRDATIAAIGDRLHTSEVRYGEK